ncbi:MAG: MutS family DNA mismatch repair protein, partial [Caldilinea sp.]
YERQQSSAELAPQVEFREEIALRGLLLDADGQEERYTRFMAWAEGDSWLHSHRHWLWVARLLPLLVLALFGLLIVGYPVLTPLLAALVVNLALLQSVGRRVGDEIDRVAAQQGVFEAYAEVFELLNAHPVSAPGLHHLQDRLGAGSHRADRQMRSLARRMPLVDIRRSIYFFPVEVATLWSFHVLWLLERWQRTNGVHVREWLEALGEVEALMALAALRFEQPEWVFPILQADAGTRVAAKALAHPLLPPDRAVGNDVQVGPPGSYLLVTGSNMSGKSTLLRAIGVNIVLAQMGGPVCAAHMALPPLAVISSMRVQDSLEAGVSFYMAELRRLKEIVDRADALRHADGPLLLYLLDEILQGTNTAERQIAARRIIRHLVDAGAIGAVSTHDLTLADAPELRSAATQVYFTEHFTRTADGPTMSFDYQLRPGIAVSTNALRLMELVGLPIGDGSSESV